MNDALDNIAEAIRSAASNLGTGNAGTEMGAIEFLAVSIKEGLDNLANAVREHAEAVREASDV